MGIDNLWGVGGRCGLPLFFFALKRDVVVGCEDG